MDSSLNATFGGDVTLSNGKALRWSSDDVRIEGTNAGDKIKFYLRNTEKFRVSQANHTQIWSGELWIGRQQEDDAESTDAKIVFGERQHVSETAEPWIGQEASYGQDLSFNVPSTSGAFIFNSGHVYPGADNSHNLGGSSKRWANIYVADAHYSNVGTGGNDVDGTEGSWTIQEGEDDLFLLNRKNGKKYKFKLEAV